MAAFQEGTRLQQAGQLEAALASYDEALRWAPGLGPALYNRGSALMALGRADAAFESYTAVLQQQPDHAQALCNRALLHRQSGRLEAALRDLDAAAAARPDWGLAPMNRATVLKDLDRLDDALGDARRATELDPGQPEAWSTLGVILFRLKRWDEALSSFDRATALRPGYAAALSNRGLVLYELERLEEACAALDAAIAFQPRYAEAYSNRGAVRKRMGDAAGAIADFRRAIELDPTFADALANLGHTLQEAGDPAGALPWLDQAIAMRPGLGRASWYKALALLKLGRFREAWPLYAWRWQTPEFLESGAPGADVRAQLPAWQPGARHVLVWAEQGVGDEIIYASMLAEFAALGHHVTARMDGRLIPLLSRSMPGVAFADRGEPLPLARFDAQIAIGDLGAVLRNEVSDFPMDRKAYLVADAQRARQLRASLIGHHERLIGISWRSQRAKVGGHKSLDLEALLPLLRLPGCAFVSLQYGDTSQEIARLRCDHETQVLQCDSVDNFSDLDGLAALITACDAVVTTSNSTAHLAGALGARTAVLTPKDVGLVWYWCNRLGTGNLWYPSLQTFGQQEPHRWMEPVLEATAFIARGEPADPPDTGQAQAPVTGPSVGRC